MNPGNLGLGQGVVIGRTPQPQSNTLRNCLINEWHADLTSFALTHHPDTPEGHTNHHACCATWHTTNPTSKPDECCQYLLTPGTAPAGSMECWSCGQRGHQQGVGPGICPGDSLPEPEHDWHQIVSYIAHEYNKQCLDRPATVNHVDVSSLTYPEYHQTFLQHSLYLGEVEDSPGNGQGSSA